MNEGKYSKEENENYQKSLDFYKENKSFNIFNSIFRPVSP